MYVKEVHVTKTEPAEKFDHVLEKRLPRVTEHQLPTQRRYGKGLERQISSTPRPRRQEVTELEVLEMREQSDKIQDFTESTIGMTKSKKSKSWRKVSEVIFDLWHEPGYLEMIYPKLLEVHER
jgi:hypothetical protein